MGLYWCHAVQVQCDLCDWRPAEALRRTWEQARRAALDLGWHVSEDGGEAVCPQCWEARVSMTPHQDEGIIDLVDDEDPHGGHDR